MIYVPEALIPVNSRSASVLELEYDKTSVVDLAVGYKWDNIQTAKEDAKA